MNCIIAIGPVFSVIECPDSILLGNLKDHLSFHDKSAAYQLFRYKKGRRRAETQMLQKYGELPEWYQTSQRAHLEKLEGAVTVQCWEALDETAIQIHTGLVSRVYKFLVQHGATVQYDHPEPVNINKRSLGKPSYTLRKPQQEVMNLIEYSLVPNIIPDSGLICIATGVGKTKLAGEIIRHFQTRTIFLVPSISILKQTVKVFAQLFGKANVAEFGGGKKKIGYVTVATYQSVNLADPKLFDQVDMVVADEVHRVAAKTFLNARTNIRFASKVFGLSATPYRADGADLLIEAACGPIIYTYTTQEAIRDGYLARPTFIIYEVRTTGGKFDRYELQTVKGKKQKQRVLIGPDDAVPYSGKNENEAYRNWVLGNEKLNRFIAEMAQAEVVEGGFSLLMIDEKQHAEKLLQYMPEAGYSYGGNKDNESLQVAFNKRQLGILMGTSTIGTGTDLLPVTMQFNLMGGSDRANVEQVRGRGLRSDPDENGVARKTTMTQIDFDFVKNKLLHRQCLAREKVYAEVGEVHRVQLF